MGQVVKSGSQPKFDRYHFHGRTWGYSDVEKLTSEKICAAKKPTSDWSHLDTKGEKQNELQ